MTEEVTQEDILYQDNDVCILKPDVKKGILIFSNIEKRTTRKSIYKYGLKTGKQLEKEGIDFGRSMIHDYSFFRAPKMSGPVIRDSIESELVSLYGPDLNLRLKVWIRIDPTRTFVYSSEIRAKFRPQSKFGTPEYLENLEQEVSNSRKTMTEYFKILEQNSLILDGINTNPDCIQKPFYNLFSSRVQMFNVNQQYPWDVENINTNSEVLVRVNILTPNFFVKCLKF